jgi:hypothetical protein
MEELWFEDNVSEELLNSSFITMDAIILSSIHKEIVDEFDRFLEDYYGMKMKLNNNLIKFVNCENEKKISDDDLKIILEQSEQELGYANISENVWETQFELYYNVYYQLRYEWEQESAN